jgi:hypothetical protein
MDFDVQDLPEYLRFTMNHAAAEAVVSRQGDQTFESHEKRLLVERSQGRAGCVLLCPPPMVGTSGTWADRDAETSRLSKANGFFSITEIAPKRGCWGLMRQFFCRCS